MQKITLKKPTKSSSEITQDWLDNCAIEGIFPSAETQAELDFFNSGKMTPEQFREYLIKKYKQK